MLLRMTDEPDDYEGPWPREDAMSEWKRVPVEPTDEMIYAALDAKIGGKVLSCVEIYRAMLDAVPAAPQQAEPVSEFQRSAPERIWLNVGDINDEDRFEDVSNDGCEWICWCKDSQDKNDVPYVRADLAHPPPAEVQRLEAASRKVLQIVDDIGRRAFTLSGWMDISELRAALDALEGK